MKRLLFFLCCLIALIFLSCSQGDILISESDWECDVQGTLSYYQTLGASDSLIAGLESVLHDTVSNEQKARALLKAMKNVQLENLQRIMVSESPKTDSARAFHNALKNQKLPWEETK